MAHHDDRNAPTHEPRAKSAQAADRVAHVADRLMTYGAPGALLALMVLRLWSVTPLIWWPLKSVKFAPVALLCCAEVSWLFGGAVGLMVVGQWLVHELAHLHALRKSGATPGWRGLIPFVGPYSGRGIRDWDDRETEARVALAGVFAGFILAATLLTAGQALDNRAMVLAAKIGFALNLINLLPFRPFDGGRIFPGLVWRYHCDETDGAADPASLRCVAACRAIVGFIVAEKGPRPRSAPQVLAMLLVGVLLAGTVVLSLAALLLPGLVFGMMLLAAFVGFAALIALVLGLDRRAVLSAAQTDLAPRRGLLQRPEAQRPLPWRGPLEAGAALLAYGLLIAALIVGVLA